MRPFGMIPLTTATDTSPDASTVKTILPPKGTSAFEITVETTNARMTLDGTTPSATNGHVIQKDNNPWYVPCTHDARIKWISTAGANSIVQVTFLS